MLFNSIVPHTFNVMENTVNNRASSIRKAESLKRVQYFEDEQLDSLYDEMSKHFASPDKFQLVCLNIVKKIIVNLAQVYREPAKRTVEGSKKDQDTFQAIAEAASLDLKMKQAQRYVKLLKTCLMRPVWRKGRLELDILTPDILDVVVGDSPEELQKVLVTHYGQSGRLEDVTYSEWTAETYRRLDFRGHEKESLPNPYKVLPFVPLWDRLPMGDFWLAGGEDLISLQDAINTKITDLLHIVQMQGFGVFWRRRGSHNPVGEAGEDVVGPGQAFILEPEAAVGFVQPEAPLQEVLEVITFLIKQAAISHGLSATSLTLDPSTASGTSKLVDSKELSEMRQDDCALWRRYEHAIFSLIRIVWNTHTPGQAISESASLSVDFADQRPAIDPKAQAETWERLLEMGVISPVDIAMQRNPDLATREEALAFLVSLQEETRSLNEQKL